MKNSSLILLLIASLLWAGFPAKAETIPAEVQKYAETEGFQIFLSLAPQLHFSDNVDYAELTLRDGYHLYVGKETPSAAALSDILSPSSDWLFPVCHQNGEGFSFLTVHTEGGMSIGAGGYSSDFVKAMTKMKALIRSFGKEEEPVVMQFGSEYLLYYSFGGDERVMEIDPADFNEAYLSVKDHTELPTGSDALAAMEKEREFWERPENQDAGGGTHLGLPLHQTANSVTVGAAAGKMTSVYLLSIAAFILAAASIVYFSVKKKNASSKE